MEKWKQYSFYKRIIVTMIQILGYDKNEDNTIIMAIFNNLSITTNTPTMVNKIGLKVVSYLFYFRDGLAIRHRPWA